MKKVSIFTLKENKKLVENVYKATFEGDISAVDRPGQFINILIKGFYLRRPLSVFECSNTSFSVIYKVVGEGTKELSMSSVGDKFDILCGLGNGYSLEGAKPVLVGGGCGIPPLYYLAKEFIKKGIKPTIIMGFNTKNEIFCEEDFKKLKLM
jgi:dihydroorotate dehydrogenase electron transfer subunit